MEIYPLLSTKPLTFVTGELFNFNVTGHFFTAPSMVIRALVLPLGALFQSILKEIFFLSEIVPFGFVIDSHLYFSLIVYSNGSFPLLYISNCGFSLLNVSNTKAFSSEELVILIPKSAFSGISIVIVSGITFSLGSLQLV